MRELCGKAFAGLDRRDAKRTAPTPGATAA